MSAPDGDARGAAVAVEGSAVDAAARPTRAAVPREPQRYATIVIVGGGCYGSYYLRQLTRARDAGVIVYDRLLVVDRDRDCRVARAARAARAATGGGFLAPAASPAQTRSGGPPRRDGTTDRPVERHHFAAVRVEIATWEAFLPAYFDAACADPESAARDAVVPSPLMPHLAHQWLMARARRRWPARSVRSPALEVAPSTPWQRATSDGATHYVSFATWMCPINCIEPPRCPETRGPRSWSMPVAARSYVAEAEASGRPLVGPLLFHCEHRAYGVGMFDARAAVEADATLSAAVAAARPGDTVRALVASVSHCHGAWSGMELGPEGSGA